MALAVKYIHNSLYQGWLRILEAEIPTYMESIRLGKAAVQKNVLRDFIGL